MSFGEGPIHRRTEVPEVADGDPLAGICAGGPGQPGSLPRPVGVHGPSYRREARLYSLWWNREGSGYGGTDGFSSRSATSVAAQDYRLLGKYRMRVLVDCILV